MHMRKDISIEILVRKGECKLNKSALARQFNCCWETIDRKLNPEKYKREKKKRHYSSKLDEFKTIIDKKIEAGNCSALAIYYLLKTKYNFSGKYGIVRKYISSKKTNIITDLTIRFETIPGYQGQVDWKEAVLLKDKYGNVYKINVFLFLLGNSRFKIIKLTFDRTQQTLFECLTYVFKTIGGTPEEIVFDNMKTIVDHTKSTYTDVILNSKAEQFAKDAGFKIYTCRPYRPMTKGKVETLAKIMNRLKAFDGEFESTIELEKIVEQLNYDLNHNEISQATNQKPCELFEKEKEYLIPVNIDILKPYYTQEKTYKVTNESMITYQGIKYSVPIQYVGKQLKVLDEDNVIHIYYNTNLIYSYSKTKKYKFNYKKEDYLSILKSSCFEKETIENIEKFLDKNVKSLDNINIEGE